MRLFATLTICLCASLICSAQTTWYVPDDFPGGIMNAITHYSVQNGDTVIVRAGTYMGNINFFGKAVRLQSEEGPENTIIDGGQNGSVVVFQDQEGPDTILSGFTIMNGTGTHLDWERKGGGIYCYDTSPTIEKNIIRNNSADGDMDVTGYGGGIACDGSSSPMIRENIITENTAGWFYTYFGWFGHGGGVYFEKSHIQLFDNIIYKNKTLNGGGVSFDGDPCTGIISGNIIYDNIATDDQGSEQGGGIEGFYGDLTITNNLIFDNVTQAEGGGVFLFKCPQVKLTNNTFYNNSAIHHGGGLYLLDSRVIAANNIFWNDSAINGPEIHLHTKGDGSNLVIKYSNVEGGQDLVHVDPDSTLSWGDGMIRHDPLFVEPLKNAFQLQYSSLCRNGGDNTAPGMTLTDVEGDPRIAEGIVDMGADEFHTHLTYTGHATPNGWVKIHFIGIPGTAPVGLCLSTAILDNPILTSWGEWWNEWWLGFPFIGPLNLGSIPAPDGVLELTGQIPNDFPAPFSLHMQAFIGDSLSNLCVMRIE